MKNLAVFAFGVSILFPSISSAAALTSDQATSLISVVQSSPGTNPSAFVPLITAFSNITTTQAVSLINVVQQSPSTPANAFISLLTSFTIDPVVVPQSVVVSPVTPAPVIGAVTQEPQPTPTPGACDGTPVITITPFFLDSSAHLYSGAVPTILAEPVIVPARNAGDPDGTVFLATSVKSDCNSIWQLSELDSKGNVIRFHQPSDDFPIGSQEFFSSAHMNVNAVNAGTQTVTIVATDGKTTGTKTVTITTISPQVIQQVWMDKFPTDITNTLDSIQKKANDIVVRLTNSGDCRTSGLNIPACGYMFKGMNSIQQIANYAISVQNSYRSSACDYQLYYTLGQALTADQTGVESLISGSGSNFGTASAEIAWAQSIIDSTNAQVSLALGQAQTIATNCK